MTDGVLTWEHTMPTLVGMEGDYEWSTNATDESCVNPFDGGGHVDLAGFDIAPDPAVTGDGVLYTTLASREYGFYEATRSGLSFSDDGLLYFGDPADYTASAPQSLPDTAEPNNLAAMLWQDMELVYDEAAGSGVTIATAGVGLGIIEFDDLRIAGDTGGAQGTTDVEVFAVTGSRDLVFAYDNVGGPLDTVTIGAENAAGDSGTALVNNGDASGDISDGTVVCGTYTKDDSPATFTYQVAVDADVSDGQVLTNQLVHTVGNPGAQPVTVTSDVTAEVASIVTIEGTQDAEEPATNGVFTLTRPEGASADAVTVSYTVAGNARPGKDYVRLDGEVTFAAGESTTTEVVEIIDRRGRNKHERTVALTLQPGDDYELGDPASASIELVDLWPRRGR